MKKIIPLLLIFCCCIVASVKAQEERTRIYEIRSNIPMRATDVRGIPLYADDRFEVPPYASQFALVRSKGDSVIIRFLYFRQYPKLYSIFNGWVKTSEVTSPAVKAAMPPGKDSIGKYFLMSRSDLDSNCIKVFPTKGKSATFSLGLVTMPMKLRLGKNFDFQGSLSLGTTAGMKMRISKYNPNYINFLFGASISAVNLDSFSTKGKVSGQPINNMAVFSPSLGMVFEFGRAQAGLFYGWDFLSKSNQTKYTWIYNKKPWISIGFGFSIFSVDSKSNSPKDPEQPKDAKPAK